MSSANCPFTIFPKKEDTNSIRRKDWYITINIPLDPSNPNSQKITHEYLKLNSTEIEEVLEFFSTFDDIVKTLALPSGPQHFRLIPAMMGHDAQKKWFDIVTNYATNQSQQELENCIERFLLLFKEEDVSLDIKEWMSEVKKPRSMSVQDFVQMLYHLNDLIEYTPIPDPTNNPGKQTPKFTDAELSRIVRNACPTGWKKAQIEANLRHLSLAAQTRYYTGLKSVELDGPASHRNKPNDAKVSNLRKNETTNLKNNKPNGSQKHCDIHGKCNHTTAQCEVIKKHREDYRAKNNANEKNNEKKNSGRPKYNTRSNASKKREENNVISNQSSYDASDANSELNQIEEIFIIQNQEETKKIDINISTEICVQEAVKPGKSVILGLLDTGATGVFIKRAALNKFNHIIIQTNVQVKGRYALSSVKEIASLTIKLPDFCSNKTIEIQAYIEDEVNGRHDIILGIRFIQQLGLIFDFLHCTVTLG